MATDLELLQTARTAILTALASNAGKPNYNIDGQSVSYDALTSRLRDLNEQIAAFQGPLEEISEGHV